MKHAALLGLALISTAASAQMEPIPSNEDSRIGVIHYADGQEVRLRTPPGTDLVVLMPRGERVQQVVVGDTGAWHASVSSAQDALTFYALHAVNATRIEVRTEQRSYPLVLTATNDAIGPYLVRIDYSDTRFGGNNSRASTPPSNLPPGTYKLAGSRELLPKSVRDDGMKTYIEWASTQAIPAVLARDKLGREEMIDGYMRDGVFTLDRVYDELVFRIDRIEARARRITVKAKR